MAQALRGLRWRAAVTIAGAAFALMYLFASGRGPGYLIQIDYSWAAEYLDSANVEIDGEIVGRGGIRRARRTSADGGL
jgi:hypothetical protein